MAGKLRREKLENSRHCEFIDDTINNAVEVYKKLPSGEVKSELRNLLMRYLDYNGYSQLDILASELLPEYKKLIRDDCYGDISSISKENLSEEYKKFFHYHNLGNNDVKHKKFSLDLYSSYLEKSKNWRNICEFDSYESIKKPLIENLYEEQISPFVLRTMSISDFRDFTRQYCYEEFVAYREKNNFVKTFINAKGDEFFSMLITNGVNGYYSEALVSSMQTKGVAWDVVAHDKNGYQVFGPEFDRHHKHPVMCTTDIAAIKEVNDFNKLVLINKEYHKYLHRLEQRYTLKSNDSDIYFRKLMAPEDAACILNFETYIMHNFKGENMKAFPVKANEEKNLEVLACIMQYTQFAKRYTNDQSTNKKNNVYLNNAASSKGRK